MGVYQKHTVTGLLLPIESRRFLQGGCQSIHEYVLIKPIKDVYGNSSEGFADEGGGVGHNTYSLHNLPPVGLSVRAISR